MSAGSLVTVPAPDCPVISQQFGSSSCKSALGPVFFDFDVLNCHVCMQPFSAQVFQCSNGHCVCQLCMAKLKEKCPTCFTPIGHIRNLILEKILESMKVPCEFTHMGCSEMIQYTKKKLHEQNCPQRPQQCPIDQCCFNGPMKDLSLHFQKSHNIQTLNFKYSKYFLVEIKTDEPYSLLHAEDNKLFILHHRKQKELGNVLYVTVFGANQCDSQRNYYIEVKSSWNTLKLESIVGPSSPSSKAMEYSSIHFLLVPRIFSASRQCFRADIFIR